MKLIREHPEGAKIYQCDCCGHEFTVPKGNPVKCPYCGKEEKIIDKYSISYCQKIKNAHTDKEAIEIINKIYEDGYEEGVNE